MLQGHLARVLEGDGGLLHRPLEAARRRDLAARTPSSAARTPTSRAGHARSSGKVEPDRRHLHRLVEPGRLDRRRQIRNAGIDLPIAANQSIGRQAVDRRSRGKITDYYSMGWPASRSYCTGRGRRIRRSTSSSTTSRPSTARTLLEPYPINGYDLGTVIQKAIETAGSTEPAEDRRGDVRDMGMAIEVASTPVPVLHGMPPAAAGQSRIEQFTKGKGEGEVVAAWRSERCRTSATSTRAPASTAPSASKREHEHGAPSTAPGAGHAGSAEGIRVHFEGVRAVDGVDLDARARARSWA